MRNDQKKIGNNCPCYENGENYPAAIAASCRGCVYSYSPDLYDGGCKLCPAGIPRHGKPNKEYFSNGHS